MTYEPNFDFDFQRGQVGENAYGEFLNGRHEVKTDFQSHRTGNFYVEICQRGLWADQWKPSGIMVTQAEWWVQASPIGLGGIFLRTDLLREIVQDRSARDAEQKYVSDRTNASKGKLIRRDDVLRRLKI